MQTLEGQIEWTPEKTERRDPLTGARTVQLTAAKCRNHPLYYLTNSFTEDSRSLVFASDRTGKVDLYRVELVDGVITRLTDLEGLQPYSGNLVGNEIYFSTAGELHALHLGEGTDRVIAERPGCGFGEVTVSSNGEWAATLVTKSASTGFLIARTDGSESNVILEGTRGIYHPQFHPTDSERLIYSADPPDARMWTVRRDGRDDRCIYENAPDEWFVHETFLGQKGQIIVVHWQRGVCEVGLDDGVLRRVADLSCWHIASSPDGSQIVCDTHLPDLGLCLINPMSGDYRTLCHPAASNKGSQWHKKTPLSVNQGAPGWATMVEEGTVETAYGPQWTHPHPSFSPNGKWVAYTSDVSGWPQAYVVEVR